MKTISPLIIICFFMVGYVTPGSFGDIAVNTGVTIPVGERAETHKPGLNFEIWGRIDLSNPGIKILLGGAYAIVPGKYEQFDRNRWHYEYKYKTGYLSSFFIGPQIIMMNKTFICPAICLNQDGIDKRYGIKLMTGIMAPVRPINKEIIVDLKIGMLNLMGNEENEPLITIIEIGAGIIL